MSLLNSSVLEILKGKNLEVLPIEQKIEILETRQTTRPEGFRLSRFAFNTFAKFDSTEVLGCGEDASDEITAKEKSISEAIERAVLFIEAQKTKSKTSSNGWAAHFSIEKAASSALYELIERDAALMHWLTQTPMKRVIAPKAFPEKFINDLKRSEFSEIETLISFDFAGPLITVLLKNSDGFAVSGHASGSTLENAILSAAIEACRAAHHFQRFEYYHETRDLLAGKKPAAPVPGAHSLMYAYHEPLPSWIIGNELFTHEKAQKLWHSESNNFLKLVESSQFSAYSANGRIIVKAENPRLQPIFWGLTESAIQEDLLNWNRIDKSKTNIRPHMVG